MARIGISNVYDEIDVKIKRVKDQSNIELHAESQKQKETQDNEKSVDEKIYIAKNAQKSEKKQESSKKPNAVIKNKGNVQSETKEKYVKYINDYYNYYPYLPNFTDFHESVKKDLYNNLGQYGVLKDKILPKAKEGGYSQYWWIKTKEKCLSNIEILDYNENARGGDSIFREKKENIDKIYGVLMSDSFKENFIEYGLEEEYMQAREHFKKYYEYREEVLKDYQKLRQSIVDVKNVIKRSDDLIMKDKEATL